MNVKRWVLWGPRFAIPLAAALALGATSVSGSVAGALHTKHTIRGANTWVAVAEKEFPDGTVQDTWRNSHGAIVSVRGLPGLIVTVLPETISRGSGHEVDHTNGLAIQGGLVKSISPTRHVAANLHLANSVYQTICADYKSSDGNVDMYGCDTQYLDQDNGGGDWYMADRQETSARSSCAGSYFCEHLRSVKNYVSYPANNQVIQWQPASTNTVGSCTNVGVSFASNQTGITYSESANICPNTFGPSVLNSLQFGGIWQGNEGDSNYYYEASEAVDEVHDPWNASPSLTYSQYDTWCDPCF